MSASEVAEKLAYLLEDSEDDGLVSVLPPDSTLGVPPNGFIVQYDDGTEYQVTVVQS